NAGSDIYAAGLLFDTEGNYWPYLWLDGILYNLPTITPVGVGGKDLGSSVNSISVWGNQVFVAGSNTDDGLQVPGYWYMTTSITERGKALSSTPVWNALTFPQGAQLDTGQVNSIV